MKKQIKILMSGALVVLPLVITVWLVMKIGYALVGLGETTLSQTGISDGIPEEYQSYAGWAGILLVMVVIYLIGLMTRFLLFSRLLKLIDRLMSRLPGIKVIYESIRDILELFGSGAAKGGYPVLYSPSGSSLRMLGIVTNENPQGRPEGDDSVLVFLPMGYMIGGPIVFASRKDIEKLDMPVETAMKLAATAFIAKEESPVLADQK